MIAIYIHTSCGVFRRACFALIYSPNLAGELMAKIGKYEIQNYRI